MAQKGISVATDPMIAMPMSLCVSLWADGRGRNYHKNRVTCKGKKLPAYPWHLTRYNGRECRRMQREKMKNEKFPPSGQWASWCAPEITVA